MQSWLVKPTGCRLTLPADRAAAMLQQVAEADGTEFARELLDIFSTQVPLDICTIIAYENGTHAEPLAHAGGLREDSFSDAIGTYVRHFVPHDGIQQVISSARGRAAEVWCQMMNKDEIANPLYRSVCYDRTGMYERLAILCQCDEGPWLSIKFYRARRLGRFSDQELERIEALVPLAVHAARLYFSSHLVRNRLRDLLLGRLRQACPALSKRDEDLLRGILDGRSTRSIASDMGIRELSVRTYQKRLYRKLGISGQREILSLCTLN